MRGAVGDRHRVAARAELLLLLVDRIAALARGREIGQERLRGGVGVHGLGRHPCALHEAKDLLVRELREDRLAHAGVVHWHALAHLGEHAHGVRGGDLANVGDPVVVEHCQVGGLAELLHELAHGRLGQGAQLAVGDLAQVDQAGAEGVAAVGQLAHVAHGHQRAQETVDGGKRQRGALAQFTQGELSTRGGNGFEQGKGALDRLDAAGAGSRLSFLLCHAVHPIAW